MRNFGQDLRYALRLLRRSHGFTLVAVLTLALGIAANTTVFSWIDNTLLNPFPGANGTANLALLETVTSNGELLVNTSFQDYRDFRDQLQFAEGVAAARFTPTYLGRRGELERIFVELVSLNYFDVLRVKPAVGRFFSPDGCGEQPESCPVAVLSDRLWRSRFHADPAVVGQTIRVNQREFTVIGVAPRQFRGGMAGLSFDIWVPLNWAPALGTGGGTLTWRATRDLTSTFVRLKPGVTIEQARAEVQALARRLAEAHPRTNRGIGATLVPLHEGHNGAQRLLQRPLRVLMAVCLVMLLLVCANVANLLLARQVTRRRELTIRTALGAGRWRLGRQLLTETLALATAGAIVGALLSLWMGQALVLLLPVNDDGLPIALDAGINLRTLAFSILMGFVTAVLAGAAPALLPARASLNDTLKEIGRSDSARSQSHRLRGLFVVTEVALALIAIAGAGLFMRSFRGASSIYPGFDVSGIVVGDFNLSPAGYTAEEQRDFCVRLRAKLEEMPGIVAASYSDVVPLNLGSAPWHQLTVEGYTPAPGEDMNLHRSLVPPGYFDMLRIPIVAGRDFTEADDANAPPAMIVNQAFVRRFFAGREPVGRKVRLEGGWRTIVGVVRDARYFSPVETPTPYFFIPFRQYFAPGLNFSFFVKAKGEPAFAIEALRRHARALNPDAAVFNAMLLSNSIGAALYPQRVAATLLSVLGVLSLLLASVGLYSVMSYSVSQRTPEIGLRMALGARPGGIVAMVLRQCFVLLIPGLILGLAASSVLSRFVTSLLYRVAPTDPLTYAAAAAFLTFCAILACCYPAIRATRVNPVDALRAE